MDHDPLDRWSFGRVTLLGDAAHAMRPVGSQAGSQAIVDARVLAHALATERDPVHGSARPTTPSRRPAMNEVILRNRAIRARDRHADGRGPRAWRLRRVSRTSFPRRELEEIAVSFKRAAGFDPETLNNRPSLSARIPR